MWEISEGRTKFLYAMKLVPPKDLGSNVHPINIHLGIDIQMNFFMMSTLFYFIKSIGTIHNIRISASNFFFPIVQVSSHNDTRVEVLVIC